MAFLELRNVSKSYGQGTASTPILSNINLSMSEGEFVAIVGFSGSGKTTLVNLIAGLTQADKGEVLLRGKPVTSAGPDRGVVFQNYSLLPWLSVAENVGVAIDAVQPKLTRKERTDLVERYIAMVNLTPAMHKKPRELSGGMRQRVSVARALAMNPDILLLDEPLAALDALTRATLQTVLLITNDVDEGMLLADRIIPLTPGPKATLGPSFAVDLERPRDRAALNNDPEFRRVRNSVLAYLTDVRETARKNSAATQGPSIELPSLKPRDLVAT
jgi:nitrate/nitrite transport system ATP-binding protein